MFAQPPLFFTYFLFTWKAAKLSDIEQNAKLSAQEAYRQRQAEVQRINASNEQARLKRIELEKAEKEQDRARAQQLASSLVF